MTETSLACCVLLPCSSQRWWVLPQRCLGEIITVSGADEPPEEISWRGEMIPVVDFGSKDPQPWRDRKAGVGLIAVVLGQREENCDYFGVALRGGDPGVSQLDEEDIEDLPEAVLDFSSAAMRIDGNVYQVPDLLALQRAIGAGEALVQ